MTSIFEQIKNINENQKHLALSWFLQMKARENRHPLSAYFELTPECNLSCKMCYSRLSHAEVEALGGLRTIDEWKNWIKQAVDMGVLYVMFTGGECLSYAGFDTLYEYAYELGAKVGIMTNAALITDERIELFKRMPPESISVTLYGFSSETYAKACGNGKAFERVMAAMEKVHAAGLPLYIKSTVTKDMLPDLPEIYRYTRKLGVQFFPFNVLMKAREACYRNCDQLSVTEEEYNQYRKEMYGLTDEKQLLAPLTDIDENKIPVEKGMLCGSGTSTFSINWKGEMIMCNSADMFSVSMKDHTVEEAWQEVVDYASQVPQLIECQFCRFRDRCHTCVFLHYGDMGEFGKVSPRLCWKKKHPEEAEREEKEFLARNK